MNNPKVYYSISNCEEHGLIRGKIRIRKTEDEKYFAVKTLRFTDTEEADGETSDSSETDKHSHE